MKAIKYLMMIGMAAVIALSIMLGNRIVLGTFEPSNGTLLFAFSLLIASLNMRLHYEEIDKILKDIWE